MELSDEQYGKIERLAALEYEHNKMALYLGVDEESFINEAADKDSKIYYHISRGILKSRAVEEMKLLKKAEEGSVTASQQLIKLRSARSLDKFKKDLLDEGRD